MGVNLIYYLVVFRFLVCVFLIFMFMIMVDFMGVVGGFFYSVYVFDIDMYYYWFNLVVFVYSFDVFFGVLKSFFFGVVIVMVVCY